LKQSNTLNGPDVELTADVKSRELRFEKVPETEIRFPGYSEDETVSGTERRNLPREVEENVTYRDSRIRLRSAAGLGGGEPALGKDGQSSASVTRAIRDTRPDNEDSRREERR
jgi:hypothetical protein